MLKDFNKNQIDALKELVLKKMQEPGLHTDLYNSYYNILGILEEEPKTIDKIGYDKNEEYEELHEDEYISIGGVDDTIRFDKEHKMISLSQQEMGEKLPYFITNVRELISIANTAEEVYGFQS